ncbi:hypothetical protein D9613_000751 [Agrocybe pediades]|uniref:Early meiotic induction protein 1 n=1 Tax=Agrocybe pediades TaxID=84607 RepID=A0A8H4QZ44_9AGAR|nr:hypothetical protein D9613_000751 [Agrocybe pediades]
MSKLDFATALAQEEARLRKLHPTPADIPGCVSVFDDYIGCSAMRNQIKSIYRFGERTNCDRKFQEFKFCLSLKVMHPEEQREVWIRRRAEWWANKRLSKSSEDVWDIREEPLPNYPKRITDEVMRESRAQA